MTDEEFAALAAEARDIRWVIYTIGGNATSRAIEDVLMARNDGLGRSMAHDTMSYLHNAGIDELPGRRQFPEGVDPPTLDDFPEIADCGVQFPRSARKENGNGS